MIEVSAEFREALANGNRNWIENIIITLTDGTVLNLDNSNIWGGTMHIDDSVSAADEFGAVGACIINSFRCTINNMYDDFSNYNFLDATVEVYVGLQLENEVESFRKGVFTVTEPSYDGVLITLECLDNMYLLDKDYSNSTLTYPATLSQIVNNICTVCGVEFGTTSFPQMDLTIPERPDDETLTCREVLSWCAMIAGCYARFDTSGILRFGWYDTATLSALRNIYDGGVFDDHSPKYASGSDADGGGFNPWDIGSVINMGAHTDISNAHNIYAVFNHSISMFDVEITGVHTSITTTDDDGIAENHEFMSGGPGYVIQLTGNKFITVDNAQNIVNHLGNQLNGMVFRKAQAECLSDATIEAGDVAFFHDSRTRISYPIIISRTEFAVGATQMVYSDAENPTFHTASRYNETTKAVVELQQQIAAEAERRSESIIDLAGQLAASSGLYTTEETTESGTIFYMHDKPTLAESRVVWKMNSEAWGVSTDGGLTWNAGMTVDGDTIVRILSATGINADWIRSGTISLGGQNNQNGSIKVYNRQGTQIGSWDNTGANISGKLTLKNYQTRMALTSRTTTYYRLPGDTSRSGSSWPAYGLLLEPMLSTTDKSELPDNTPNDAACVFEAIGSVSYSSPSQPNVYRPLKYIRSVEPYTSSAGHHEDVAHKKFGSYYTALGDYYAETKYSDNNTIIHKAMETGGVYTYEIIDLKSRKASVAWNIGLDPDGNAFIGFYRNYSSGGAVHTGQDILRLVCTSSTSTSASYKLYVNGKETAFVSTSSIRYKHNITEKLDKTLSPELLYKLKIKQFVYNSDASLQYNDMKDKTIPGFIAEDVDEIYPAAVIHNDDGEVESWDERRLLPPMLALIQEQKKQIDDLENRVAKLEAMVNSLIDRR